MDIRMPDGVILRGIPEGTPKDVIMQKYQEKSGYKPQEEEPQQEDTAIGPIEPGQSISTVTGQPVTEGEMLKSGAGEGQQMIANVPGSAAELGKGLYQAVRHLPTTVKGVGKLALGAGAKAIPGEQPFEEYADAFGQMYKERYGADFRNTIKDDPVGVLADFAGFLTMGGMAVRGAGALGKVAKIPQAAKVTQAGKALQQAGATIEPLNVAKQTVVKPITVMVPKKAAPYLYKQAAKFSARLPEAKRDELARLGVEKGVMPTSAGIDKVNKFLKGFDTEIESMIKQIDKKGKAVNKKVIFKHLKKLRREMGGVKLEGTKDLKIINRVAKELDLHLKKINKKFLTADDLQEFKKDIYRRVSYDRKRGSLTLPKELSAKVMARSAKEQLVKMHPELQGVNEKYGPMRELLEAIEHRASVIEGSQILTFDPVVKAAAGRALAGPVGQVAGGGMGILEMPRIKAKVAIALSKVKRYQPKARVSETVVRSVAREGERAEPKLNPRARIGQKKVGKYTVGEINKIKKAHPKATKAKDGFYYVNVDGVKNRITF